MDTYARITDINLESTVKIIEYKFNSINDRNKFYELAKKEIIHRVSLRNGPFFSDDENVVSIGYKPEDKQFIMNYIKQYANNHLDYMIMSDNSE